MEIKAINDFNDKQMISSYYFGKRELVNWYLELLENGSNKYIVPQGKACLETVCDQLTECHKQMIAFKVKRSGDRSSLDIQYPKGYEG